MSEPFKVFRVCEKGHDLTLPDAYAYNNSGHRYCRLCETGNKPGRKRFTLDLTPVN